jgi:hypothetical protein
MRVLIESHSGPSRNLEPPLTDQQINVLLKALSGFEVVGSDALLEPITADELADWEADPLGPLVNSPAEVE